LEKEQILQQFDVMEKKVKKISEYCKNLQEQNFKLTNNIKLLEDELTIKVESENNYNKVKDVVKNKIDSLLGKLSDIDV